MSNEAKTTTGTPTSTTQTSNDSVPQTFPARASATFAATNEPVPLLPPPGATEALAEVPAAPPPPAEAPPPPPTPPPKVDPADHGLLKMNACAFTMAEFRAMNGIKGLLTGVVIKLLRQKHNAITDLPTVADIAPFRVEAPEIPTAGKDRLVALANEFLENGYQAPLWYELVDTFNSASYYFGVLPHCSGDSFAVISFRSWSLVQPTKVSWSATVCSALENGGFAYTVSDGLSLGAPANYHACLAGKGADVHKLLADHAKLLHRVGKPVRKLLDAESVRAAAEARHAGLARFYVERGLFKPLTDDDRALAKASRIDGPYAVHADVLLEIQRQYGKQRAGSGKLSKLLLLGVTLGLFMYAQKSSTTWQYVATLAGVVFFHELGHFIAMKLFGYRDVKMFFVPFFGAAVTGRKVSVAVWKRALVALAGPLPGIFLGVVLGGMALVTHRTDYNELVKMLLIINLANLLPVMPLDGGQFMEAVLFSRSPVLSVIFRAIGAAGLLGLYFLTQSKALLYLAIAIGMTLPAVYRVAKVAEDLRKEGGVEPDVDQNIPPQTAGLIVSRLRAALPAGNNRKTLAIYATQVYERVAMPHASWLACAGLLALYLGTIVVGGVFGSVLYAASQGSLGRIAQWSNTRSSHSVDAARLESWDGAQTCAGKPHITVVATFKTTSEALQNYAALKTAAPAVASLRLFGDSIFVMLPAGDDALRRDWFARLDVKTKGVFVLKDDDRGTMRLQFIALGAEQAKQLDEDLGVYFSLGQFKVPPPWAEDNRDAATRERFHAAQLTYYKALHTDMKAFEYSAAERKELSEAMRRGDQEEIKRISEQQAEKIKRAREQQRAELRKQPWCNADVLKAVEEHEASVEAMRQKKKFGDEYMQAERAFHQKVAPLLGTTVNEERSAQPPGSLGAWGVASHEGVYFDLQYIGFHDLAHGAPALMKWLQPRGTSMTYEIQRASADDDN